jgi:hypothetical protein
MRAWGESRRRHNMLCTGQAGRVTPRYAHPPLRRRRRGWFPFACTRLSSACARPGQVMSA